MLYIKKNKNMKEKISYTKAYEELNSILQNLQNAPVSDLDDMVKQVKKATELISLCREKLRKAEADLSESFKEIA
jgi:exodeoxyribonuclease VII small subunit